MQHGDGKLIIGNKTNVGKWELGERLNDWIEVIEDMNLEVD